jgi:threonine dehydrogenase-like Zn-dependent dehydrogenase
MRAAVVQAGGAVEVVDVPEPAPGPGQALVRSLACGICGSDLHVVEMERALGAPGAGAGRAGPGIVLGHEFSVEVVDLGPGTSAAVAPGALACAVPYLTGAAAPELIGFSPTAPGAFADYLLVDADKLIPVPSDLTPEAAALTEPLAVGRHAADLGRLERGRPAVVVGCGPVGLAVLLALKVDGHGPVLVSDPRRCGGRWPSGSAPTWWSTPAAGRRGRRWASWASRRACRRRWSGRAGGGRR